MFGLVTEELVYSTAKMMIANNWKCFDQIDSIHGILFKLIEKEQPLLATAKYLHEDEDQEFQTTCEQCKRWVALQLKNYFLRVTWNVRAYIEKSNKWYCPSHAPSQGVTFEYTRYSLKDLNKTMVMCHFLMADVAKGDLINLKCDAPNQETTKMTL